MPRLLPRGLGFHVVEDVFDLAVGADHEGGAGDALHFFAVQFSL